MAEMKNAYIILVGKPEGKRPLGRRRRRWEDDIKWILGNGIGKMWIGGLSLTILNTGSLL
jgi:hypothetical protein